MHHHLAGTCSAACRPLQPLHRLPVPCADLHPLFPTPCTAGCPARNGCAATAGSGGGAIIWTSAKAANEYCWQPAAWPTQGAMIAAQRS
jgi:hypothetical protein